MLAKMNSTNGYFTHGTYQNKYLLQYTAKSTVDAGTNSVTKSATLLDEAGNTVFPGTVTSSDCMIPRKGTMIHSVDRNVDGIGFILIASLTIIYGHPDQLVAFDIIRRSDAMVTRVNITFTNPQTLDPDLSSFTTSGPASCAMVKTGTSTWDLYVESRVSYDSCTVLDLKLGNYARSRINVTWKAEVVTALPEGHIKAVPVDSEVTNATVLGKLNHGLRNTVTGSYSHAEGIDNNVSGAASHAEGFKNTISSSYGHAEGYVVTVDGQFAHAEGCKTRVGARYAHAEGNECVATGVASHAEGNATSATGQSSHAEGNQTVATAYSSHAEGFLATASGDYAHAEGFRTSAKGHSSHAEGVGTVAASDYQHVSGRYNVEDATRTYAYIIGGGVDGYPKNIFTVDWSGNVRGASFQPLLTTMTLSSENYASAISLGNETASVSYMETSDGSSSPWFGPSVTETVDLGNPSYRWKNIYVSGSVITTSDARNKNSINPLDTSKISKFIMSLNPVSYKMNDGTSGRTHYGLIAQDIEEVMMSLGMDSTEFAGFIKSSKKKEIFGVDGIQIVNDDEDVAYALRYEEFISPLIKVVQEQQKEIDSLKLKNEQLTQKYSDLSDKIDYILEELHGKK